MNRSVKEIREEMATLRRDVNEMKAQTESIRGMKCIQEAFEGHADRPEPQDSLAFERDVEENSEAMMEKSIRFQKCVQEAFVALADEREQLDHPDQYCMAIVPLLVKRDWKCPDGEEAESS